MVNLPDKMKIMKSNLNQKVNNLTEEVQKLNTNFELLKDVMYGPKLKHCIKKVILLAFMYLMATSK